MINYSISFDIFRNEKWPTSDWFVFKNIAYLETVVNIGMYFLSFSIYLCQFSIKLVCKHDNSYEELTSEQSNFVIKFEKRFSHLKMSHLQILLILHWLFVCVYCDCMSVNAPLLTFHQCFVVNTLNVVVLAQYRPK